MATSDHLKIILIGDSGVGKSSLIVRFVDGAYCDQRTTIGLDTKNKTTVINGTSYSLDLWDTAGCEKFQSLSPSFYRNADCILVVYDVSRRDTFEKLDYWMDEIETHCKRDRTTILIVGQKVDKQRAVSNSEGQRAARKHAVLFAEVSAKNDISVDEAFNMVLREAHDKRRGVAQTTGSESDAAVNYFSVTHSRGRAILDRQDNVVLEGKMIRFGKYRGDPQPRVTQCFCI